MIGWGVVQWLGGHVPPPVAARAPAGGGPTS